MQLDLKATSTASTDAPHGCLHTHTGTNGGIIQGKCARACCCYALWLRAVVKRVHSNSDSSCSLVCAFTPTQTSCSCLLPNEKYPFPELHWLLLIKPEQFVRIISRCNLQVEVHFRSPDQRLSEWVSWNRRGIHRRNRWAELMLVEVERDIAFIVGHIWKQISLGHTHYGRVWIISCLCCRPCQEL